MLYGTSKSVLVESVLMVLSFAMDFLLDAVSQFLRTYLGGVYWLLDDCFIALLLVLRCSKLVRIGFSRTYETTVLPLG